MPHKIIDTNVFMAASGLADHLPPDSACERQSLRLLIAFFRHQQFKVVFDNLGEAIREYKKNLKVDPNPSAPLAHQILAHLNSYRFNPESEFYVQVQITKVEGGEEGEFAEYPADERLATFDPSDRKWVAMAIAHQQQYGSPAPIVNAVDSDWLPVQPILAEYGVQVEQICPA